MMLYTSWRSFGHILVTVTIELLMEQALLTVESPVNTGKIWWARLDLNQRPLPCEGSAFSYTRDRCAYVGDLTLYTGMDWCGHISVTLWSP